MQFYLKKSKQKSQILNIEDYNNKVAENPNNLIGKLLIMV